MSELDKIKASYKSMSEQLKDARRVIRLYRRWEHASDVESMTGDEADTDTMLTEASFAAQDFIEKWDATITTQESQP